MAETIGKMQTQIKKTSSDLFLFSLKFLSGLVLGLTFALIMQVVLGHAEGEDTIAFLFVMALTTAAFLRVSKAWSLTATLVFDLICILVGMLLRLYIMVAPNA